MGTERRLNPQYELSGGVKVTRWWNGGAFRWTLHTDTLDAGQIAELFNLLDPIVGDALLKAAREKENGPSER